MGKHRQSSKVKEPVRLRAKKIANGCRSLYLDTYIDGKRSYEFLRIYLIPEKTVADKEANATALRAANAIKAARILDIINGKANIKTSCGNPSISDWISEMIGRKTGKRSKSSIGLMRRLGKHLEIHSKGLMVKDIDRGFCVGFAEYLRTAKALNSTKYLGQGTQNELLNALSIVLNEAVRAGVIPSNPMRMLTAAERIRKPESTREYLTPEEVKRLMEVSGGHIADADDIAAFIFCCFCGLRYSDAAALKWENVIETESGKEIRTVMKKTGRPVTVPLSAQAYALLPAKGASAEHVFTFPSYAVTLRRLKKVAEAGGITKKVTFHVSRHTFATMMLTAGADLYTISKLVGHADIRTTQIYSKVVDRRKREAVALLDRLF